MGWLGWRLASGWAGMNGCVCIQQVVSSASKRALIAHPNATSPSLSPPPQFTSYETVLVGHPWLW